MNYLSSLCLATTLVLSGTPLIALELPVVSPNAYRVPYLGLDGSFNLNQDDNEGFNDSRNPKRITVEKMETFTFFSDTQGQNALAKNCRYVYLGALGDPKYYAQYKQAVWDLFELLPDDKQDPNCSNFKYLTVAAPNDGHMHVRYGTTSLEAILNISNDSQPWTPTYCTDGKTRCGEG